MSRVLIGGLGFGFTLKAALQVLPAGASVTIAEMLGAVIEWNRNPAYKLAADALADSRVTVVQQDVSETIRGGRSRFDAIILDVDNGPTALSTAGNGRLYDADGLRQARAALRGAGCVAFWSAAPDPAFERSMARAGFQVEVKRCRSFGNTGRWHTLFLGMVG
jgi:spermidine synthase